MRVRVPLVPIHHGYSTSPVVVHHPLKESLTMFLRNDENFLASRYPSQTIVPGYYYWDHEGIGMWFNAAKLQEESHAPYPYQQEVLNRVQRWIDVADGYRRLGLTYKRGFLFHGAPGCGKTAVMRMVAARWIASGGIVLVEGSQGELQAAIQAASERGVRTLVLLDDVDQMNQPHLTCVMDGAGKCDNVMFLATTNFIGQVEERLRRPGRLDEVIEVVPPQAEDLTAWILGLDIPQDQKDWIVEHAVGCTPAEVRELLIRCHLFNDRTPVRKEAPAKDSAPVDTDADE